MYSVSLKWYALIHFKLWSISTLAIAFSEIQLYLMSCLAEAHIYLRVCQNSPMLFNMVRLLLSNTNSNLIGVLRIIMHLCIIHLCSVSLLFMTTVFCVLSNSFTLKPPVATTFYHCLPLFSVPDFQFLHGQRTTLLIPMMRWWHAEEANFIFPLIAQLSCYDGWVFLFLALVTCVLN